MYVYVCIHACECRGLHKPEKNIGTPGGRVPGPCELPHVGAGKQTQVLCKTLYVLNHRGIFPVPLYWVFVGSDTVACSQFFRIANIRNLDDLQRIIVSFMGLLLVFGLKTRMFVRVFYSP